MSGYFAAKSGVFNPAAGASSYVTSIQAFSVTIAASSLTGTATITSVDTTKAVIFTCSQRNNNVDNELYGANARVTLTDATTITATRANASASYTVTVVGYIVVFTAAALASNVQYGSISLSLLGSNTATISAVGSGAVVIMLGWTENVGNGLNSATYAPAIDLTNSTTVTAVRDSVLVATTIVNFVVVDFATAIIQSIQKRSNAYTTNGVTNADTISAVTTANTMILNNGSFSAVSSLINSAYALQLTSTTNVNQTRGSTDTTSRTSKYTVLEFKTGVINTIQRLIAVVTGTTQSETISSVTTAKSIINFTGCSSTGTSVRNFFPSAVLLDATTVFEVKGASAADTNAGWETVEFV